MYKATFDIDPPKEYWDDQAVAAGGEVEDDGSDGATGHDE